MVEWLYRLCNRSPKETVAYCCTWKNQDSVVICPLYGLDELISKYLILKVFEYYPNKKICMDLVCSTSQSLNLINFLKSNFKVEKKINFIQLFTKEVIKIDLKYVYSPLFGYYSTFI